MKRIFIFGVLLTLTGLVATAPAQQGAELDTETYTHVIYSQADNATDQNINESGEATLRKSGLVFCRTGNYTTGEIEEKEFEQIEEGLVVTSVSDECRDEKGLTIAPDKTEELERSEKTILERIMERIGLFN